MFVDNTVGSLSSLLFNPEDSYILGLWGADKYVRSSSIGLSTTNVHLLKKFIDFFNTRFPKDRVRIRVYGTDGAFRFGEYKVSYCKPSKHRLQGMHVYVNSRPLVREFYTSLELRKELRGQCLYSYAAGRFDGDGSISSGSRSFLRIVYGNERDVSLDKNLLEEFSPRIYKYEKAGTYCLYIPQRNVSDFLSKTSEYSIKLR